MVVAAAMTVTVSACGHVWDSRVDRSRPRTSHAQRPRSSPTRSSPTYGDAHADATSDPRSTTSPTATPPTAVSPTAVPEPPAPTPATAPTPTATTQPPSAPQPPAMLRPGDKGPEVLACSSACPTSATGWGHRTDVGVASPPAVYAPRRPPASAATVGGASGHEGAADGVRPTSRNGGTGIEVDVPATDIPRCPRWCGRPVLNTSTGSNVPMRRSTRKTYRGSARTPAGPSASSARSTNWTGPLGRSTTDPSTSTAASPSTAPPRFRPHPASHGCARVSNAAMDLIWAENSMAIGARVTVY